METIRTDQPDIDAGKALSDVLLRSGSTPILLLVSGGSALDVLANCDTTLLGAHVTLGLIDERFSNDASVRNYTALRDTDFFKDALKCRVHILDASIQEGESSEAVAQRFEDQILAWIAWNPQGKIIAILGVGEDGHIAGIMPGTYDTDFFGSRLVVSYLVSKDVNMYTNRITITFGFLRSYVHQAFVYARGPKKMKAIDLVLASVGDIAQTPARIFREMKSVRLFTDKRPIETIKGSHGSEVSLCPGRGGIIISIKLSGTEILYMDEETFYNEAKTVKGGVPILFPNAGAFENPKFPLLKQHGFARDSSEWESEIHPDRFKETLLSDTNTLSAYPYDFKLSVDGTFQENGSFTLSQKVENLEKEKVMPIAMGLHPYFKVPSDRKREIKFNFEGGKVIEEQVKKWANGEHVSIDNPKVKDPSAVMEIVIPNLGVLVMDASAEYRKIWIWSMTDKDFICIEPVMRDPGGLAENPEMIAPQEAYKGSLNLSLRDA